MQSRFAGEHKLPVVLLYGNCQMRVLHDALRAAVALCDMKVQFAHVADVHMLSKNDVEQLLAIAKTTSALICQSVTHAKYLLRTEEIMAELPDACPVVQLPSIHFDAYWPNYTSLQVSADSTEPVYSDAIMYQAVQRGLSDTEIIELLASPLYTREQILEGFSMAAKRLEYREKQMKVDVCIADFLSQRSQEERLLHTLNHPGKQVFDILLARTLTKLAQYFDAGNKQQLEAIINGTLVVDYDMSTIDCWDVPPLRCVADVLGLEQQPEGVRLIRSRGSSSPRTLRSFESEIADLRKGYATLTEEQRKFNARQINNMPFQADMPGLSVQRNSPVVASSSDVAGSRRGAMPITTIVIPLIRHEFHWLRSWLRYCPPSGAHGIRLVFSLDTCWNADQKSMVRDVLDRSSLARENWAIDFLDCGLKSEESFYVKDPKAPFDIDRFPYGQKSGPNLQFFRTLNLLMAQQPAPGAALLMEVDAFPLRNGWLKDLNAQVAELPQGYVIAGARYSGSSPLAAEIAGHVNGNSIYNLGNPDFRRFLAAWEQLLLAALRIVPYLAYDIVIEWFLNYSTKNPHVGRLRNADMDWLGEVHRKGVLHLADYLVNLGGYDESQPTYSLDPVLFQRRFPKAIVVHGKCFLNRIYQLRHYYAGGTDDIRYRHPVNISISLVKDKKFEDALLGGFLGGSYCEYLARDVNHLSAAQRHLLQSQLALK